VDAVECASIDTPVGLPAEEAGGQVMGDVGDEGDRETLLGLAVSAVPQQVASRARAASTTSSMAETAAVAA